MQDPIRLNKAIARAGICSRRKADELISSGQVKLNGLTVHEMGTMINPAKDKVVVRGKQIFPQIPGNDDYIYLIMNKPVQVMTTLSDPQARKTVIDFLPAELKNHRLFPVGRLDFFSEGLLIMTNDGELTHRLTHPSWKHPKVYRIEVREKPGIEAIKTMEKGMTLKDGQKLAPAGVRITSSEPGRFILEMTLIQGINRQIRRMCQDLGLTILRLIRTDQGPITLGSLRPGQSRQLSDGEITALKKSVGL